MSSRKRREKTAENLRGVGLEISAVFGGYQVMVEDTSCFLSSDEGRGFVYGVVVGSQLDYPLSREKKPTDKETT